MSLITDIKNTSHITNTIKKKSIGIDYFSEPLLSEKYWKISEEKILEK